MPHQQCSLCQSANGVWDWAMKVLAHRERVIPSIWDAD